MRPVNPGQVKLDPWSDSEEGEQKVEDDEYTDLAPGPPVVDIDNVKYFFEPEEIPNDGNCFFNSLIALGCEKSVQKLREIAKNNGGQENIEADGEWANAQDIRAVAQFLGIRIRVIVFDLKNEVLQKTMLGQNDGPVYNLAHINGGHYVPLRRGG